jgi:ribA/ribD-fused uncharacterized protein
VFHEGDHGVAGGGDDKEDEAADGSDGGRLSVRLAKSLMIAARIGRSRKRPLRTDWEAVKDEIMYEAVLAKFTQHTDLRETLLAISDAMIVEHTETDRYWGDGGDGSGQNRLGQILMRVREELQHGQNGDDPAEAGLRHAERR